MKFSRDTIGRNSGNATHKPGPFDTLIPFAAWFIGAATRLILNFHHAYPPGTNGGYYPVQVRSLIETGSLAFPDQPFVFRLQASVALLLGGLSNLNRDAAVLLAVRMVDAVVPALIAVPVFLLVRTILDARTPWRRPAVFLFTLAAVLSPGLLRMSSELTKNGVGMVWVALCILGVLRLTLSITGDDGNRIRNVIGWGTVAVAGLVLSALTHSGAFGVALLFSGVGLVVLVAVSVLSGTSRIGNIRLIGIFLVLAAILVLLFSPVSAGSEKLRRVTALARGPLRLFEMPVVLTRFGALPPPSPQARPIPPDRHPPQAANMPSPAAEGIAPTNRRPSPLVAAGNLTVFFTHIAAAALLVLLISRRKTVVAWIPVGTAAAATGLFLTSPLIGIEWADRFRLMADLPFLITTAILIRMFFLPSSTHTGQSTSAQPPLIAPKLFMAAFFAASAFMSISTMATLPGPEIDEDTERDIIAIDECLGSSHTLLVARHGLEWWTAWVTHRPVAQQIGLETSDWNEYDRVVYLKENRVDSDGPTGTGTGGMSVPENVMEIYEGSRLIALEVPSPPASIGIGDGPPDVAGLVTGISDSGLEMMSEYGRITVILKDETVSTGTIQPGAFVRVWGRGIPFTKRIVASTVYIERAGP